jgi:hypothetical protein
MNAIAAFATMLALAAGAAPGADAELKPFVLARKITSSDVSSTVKETRTALEAAGFVVVGSYEPYPDATVLVVTSDELKAIAAQNKTGGYAAGQRITVTKVGDDLQVAFTNPVYMQHAYRLKADLAPVADKLAAALGTVEEYGPKDGRRPKDLRRYHYMIGMPYFDEPFRIATFASHAEAVAAVEAGLAEGRGGARKVSRIDLPETDETVFGVALSDGCGGDAHVMEEIDFKPIRSTGHLPYELLVSGGEIFALHAKFRIAVNFPDLSMMGSHSFMNIRCAPDSIEGALKRVAGAQP